MAPGAQSVEGPALEPVIAGTVTMPGGAAVVSENPR